MNDAAVGVVPQAGNASVGFQSFDETCHAGGGECQSRCEVGHPETLRSGRRKCA
jgi:hypothetical protein